jgi:spore germination cell wall hydrolase CwlJ-like protein
MTVPTKLLAVLLFATVFLAAYVNNTFKLNESVALATNAVHSVSNAVSLPNIEHLNCLAANIYHEAANEPYMGQIAVARVVMNRILHGYGSNPCKVIYQSHIVSVPDSDESVRSCQFSWVCQGKSRPNENNPQYKLAKEIAHKVLTEDAWSDIIPSNVLFFHNTSVKPNWPYNPVFSIGNHIFYSKSKKHQKI